MEEGKSQETLKLNEWALSVLRLRGDVTYQRSSSSTLGVIRSFQNVSLSESGTNSHCYGLDFHKRLTGARVVSSDF